MDGLNIIKQLSSVFVQFHCFNVYKIFVKCVLEGDNIGGARNTHVADEKGYKTFSVFDRAFST